MYFLTSTSDALQVVTAAAGKIDCHASYVDLASGAVTAGRTNLSLTTATAGTLVASPAASTTRNIKSFRISNNHATVAQVVTVQHTDGTTVIPLESVTLAPGEAITYGEGSGMRVLGSAGVERSPYGSLLTGNGNTADQTANAADTYLAGSAFNVYGRLKVGSVLSWNVSATKTAAGAATPIWSVRFGTAGTTADTARLTFTGLAQTAIADTAYFYIVMVVRALGASGIVSGTYTLAHPLAATGFATQATDVKQATSATFDTTVTNLIAGVSVNPGTAGVWTIKDVAMTAANLAG